MVNGSETAGETNSVVTKSIRTATRWVRDTIGSDLPDRLSSRYANGQPSNWTDDGASIAVGISCSYICATARGTLLAVTLRPNIRPRQLEPLTSTLAVNGSRGTATFTAAGMVRLFADFGEEDLIFSQEINGTGTLELGGILKPNGVILTDSVGLTFEPPITASPTPEPASMLLLGTGLAAAWEARRVRRA